MGSGDHISITPDLKASISSLVDGGYESERELHPEEQRRTPAGSLKKVMGKGSMNHCGNFLAMRRISGWLVTLVLAGSFLSAGHLMAQGITTGTIMGTIVDPQGAVVPAANLTATNLATGVKLATQSLANGAFAFRDVPIGRYALDIDASGFSRGAVPSVVVVSGVTTDLKAVKLGVSASAQRVEVTGGTTPLLQVSESQVTTTFGVQTLESIPLNNAFDTVTEVIPGIVSTHADNFSNTNGDNFSVNGQSGRYNNFELDGQTNNDNTVGGPQIFFGNQDALAEIEVISNDYSAQYGRNSGAVVNYITKSGTDAFHGSAFEFYQGSFLSSLENQEKNPLFGFCAPGQNPSSGCSVPVLPRSIENRFGATLGGPILKNKLFFFGSGYWDRQHTGAIPQTSTALTPTPAGLTALAATFPGNSSVEALQNYGPYAVKVGNPTAVGAVTDETVTGPGGVTATNVPFSFVQRFVPSPYNDEEFLGRLDWQPTEKDRLFARYLYQNALQENYFGDVPSGGYANFLDTIHTIGADWTHTFSPNWVDQLRYSFQQSGLGFPSGDYKGCNVSTPAACPADITINGGFESFGLSAGLPQGRVVKVTQVQDNAIWTHGNQAILFGGEVDYQNSPQTGLFNYNGAFTFNDFNNFISDAPGSGQPASNAEVALTDGPITTKYKETDIALYLQDDWKVTPTLTAHLGLRWEYFSPAFNVLHSETVSRESNPATAFWDTTLPLADRTFPAIQNFYKGFEPRIGFAWNPTFDSKLVVKAGYSINENPAFYNIALLSGNGAPVVVAGTIDCTGGSSCIPSGGDISGAAVRALNLPSLPRGGDPRILDQTQIQTNLVPPYTQTYTLAIDHQIGSAAVVEIRYVGSLTEKNFQSRDANPYLLPVKTDYPAFAPVTLCSDTSAVGYGRPNCNFGNVAEVDNGGWAKYNGLQTNLTTRNLHGATGTFSYTYSKTMDNVTDALASTYAGGSSLAFAQNPLNTDIGERSVSGNNFTNVIGAQLSYQVPDWNTDNRIVAKLTHGFEINAFYRFDSGQPYTPFQTIGLDAYTPDVSYCDGAFNSSSVGPAVDTCRLIRSNKSAPLSSVAYLNPYTGPVGPGGPALGTPQYVVYGSDSATFDGSGNFLTYNPGTPISPTAAHWIIDNKAYAQSVGNPYPGSSRGIESGDTFSELDAGIVKNTKLTERITLQLSMNAYNALNQMYRGSPETYVGNTATFGSYDYSSGSHVPGNTTPSGTRFILLGGKIIF